MATEKFDYIIVGGGTAGLTVADRLTADPDVDVVVIEAGGDRTADPLVLTPGLVGGQYGNPDYDWNFNSVAQKELNGRCINQPRGKQLGGSSALNFLMLVYPSRHSIDAWAKMGNPGWDYDSLAPYLAKFATVHAPPQSAVEALGPGATYHDDGLRGDGPVHVSFSEGYGPNNKAWLDTFGALGLGKTGDIKDGTVSGAFQQPGSIDPATKTRSYAATAHYGPDVRSRPNLTVLTNTVVKKILLDTQGPEPVATGVLAVSEDGTEKSITATEVILSAGSLMTPQILELSGIGSRSVLDKFGIPCVVDNSMVGENLQDHPIVCQSFEVKPGIPSSDILRDASILQQLLGLYTSSQQGPLGQSNITVAYTGLLDGDGAVSPSKLRDLFSTHDSSLQSPDGRTLRSLLETTSEPSAEYMLFPGQLNTNIANPGSMADYLAPTRPSNFLTILTLLNHPFSRGSVHITSDKIGDLPAWDPALNSNPVDLDIAARHVQFVETIISTPPLAHMFQPGGQRSPETKGDTLEGAAEIVRQTMVTDFHPAGSCAMRPLDEGGVVDQRLRVYGVKGLRVVDASVFPLEPAGNIQSLVYAVAEKAADMIKEDRK